MNENELLRAIAGRWEFCNAASLLVGPGDDCAVIATHPEAAHGRLVVGVDQLVEGRHFESRTPVELIARKAVGRAVSDLAAMAARPAWALATALYDPADARIDELAAWIHEWGLRWKCPVVGGDLASWGKASGRSCDAGSGGVGGEGGEGGRPLVLGVTAAGWVDSGTPPIGLRSSARPGDCVWVTGRFGGSFESGRHLLVTPRVCEGLALRAALGDDLHAMIDVSDGLGLDAHRIAVSSGVRIEIEAELVPRHEGVADWRRACSDGEDYELCFTTPRASLNDLEGWASEVALTRVGRVIAVSPCGQPEAVVIADGRLHGGSKLGWDHAQS